MAPAYKLTYFNITGLGEPIRLLLSYGNIEFEDIRVSNESWPDLKPTMPFGQMPIIEQNGKRMHQSKAICRYLAKQVKLAGKNDWEDLEIDAAVDTFYDLCDKIANYYYETNETVKETARKILFDETLPYYLKKLDEQAQKNGGYLAVGRLTWAGVFFLSQLDYVNFILKGELIANSPNLRKVTENVLAQPGIKTWMKKRPKTEM